jgi:putative DNA primase/helicase
MEYLNKLTALMEGIPEEEKLDHVGLSHKVIEALGSENIKCTGQHVWIWDKNAGVWRLLDQRENKQIIQKTLKSLGYPVSRNLVDNITEVFKTETYNVKNQWNTNQEIINFSNGELHWVNKRWELKPHIRENFCTTQIPHAYDPEATAPRFKQFLLEIFEGDEDQIEKAKLLLEMMGYSLASHARFERLALLVGNGANGKSVVLEVIRAICGAKNVSAVQPSQFGNKFQRAHLHLKLVNLVTEISEGYEMADAELKAIVSGEITTVENKHQAPFEIRPYATCWFGTNHLPHTRDFSDALFRRAIVITFNRTFTEGVNADPKLKDKLHSEIPGIINMALKAYGNVLKRSGFKEPESCKQAKKEWRYEADQVAQFVGEMCTPDPTVEVSSYDLYSSFHAWAGHAGIVRKVGRKNFSSRIVRLGYELSRRTGGTRMIRGLKVIQNTNTF